MTNEPPVTINTSDAGVGASGLTVGQSTPPISPLRQDDLDTFLEEDGFNFNLFSLVHLDFRRIVMAMPLLLKDSSKLSLRS